MHVYFVRNLLQVVITNDMMVNDKNFVSSQCTMRYPVTTEHASSPTLHNSTGTTACQGAICELWKKNFSTHTKILHLRGILNDGLRAWISWSSFRFLALLEWETWHDSNKNAQRRLQVQRISIKCNSENLFEPFRQKFRDVDIKAEESNAFHVEINALFRQDIMKNYLKFL